MNYRYLSGQTVLPACMPYPRFLSTFDLSDAARLLYCFLMSFTLERNETDVEGRLYATCSIEEMAANMSKSVTTIKRLLKELETSGLLQRKRSRIGVKSRIYLCLPVELD